MPGAFSLPIILSSCEPMDAPRPCTVGVSGQLLSCWAEIQAALNWFFTEVGVRSRGSGAAELRPRGASGCNNAE